MYIEKLIFHFTMAVIIRIYLLFLGVVIVKSHHLHHHGDYRHHYQNHNKFPNFHEGMFNEPGPYFQNLNGDIGQGRINAREGNYGQGDNNPKMNYADRYDDSFAVPKAQTLAIHDINRHESGIPFNNGNFIDTVNTNGQSIQTEQNKNLQESPLSATSKAALEYEEGRNINVDATKNTVIKESLPQNCVEVEKDGAVKHKKMNPQISDDDIEKSKLKIDPQVKANVADVSLSKYPDSIVFSDDKNANLEIQHNLPNITSTGENGNKNDNVTPNNEQTIPVSTNQGLHNNENGNSELLKPDQVFVACNSGVKNPAKEYVSDDSRAYQTVQAKVPGSSESGQILLPSNSPDINPSKVHFSGKSQSNNPGQLYVSGDSAASKSVQVPSFGNSEINSQINFLGISPTVNPQVKLPSETVSNEPGQLYVSSDTEAHNPDQVKGSGDSQVSGSGKVQTADYSVPSNLGSVSVAGISEANNVGQANDHSKIFDSGNTRINNPKQIYDADRFGHNIPVQVFVPSGAQNSGQFYVPNDSIAMNLGQVYVPGSIGVNNPSQVYIPGNSGVNIPREVYVTGNSGAYNPGNVNVPGNSAVYNPGQIYLISNLARNNPSQAYQAGNLREKSPSQSYVHVNYGGNTPGQISGDSGALNPGQVYVMGNTESNNPGQIYIPVNSRVNNPNEVYVPINADANNPSHLSNGQTILVPVNNNQQYVSDNSPSTQLYRQTNNAQIYVPVNYNQDVSGQNSYPSGNTVTYGNTGPVMADRPTDRAPLLIANKDMMVIEKQKTSSRVRDKLIQLLKLLLKAKAINGDSVL